jgi:hypothetical protein
VLEVKSPVLRDVRFGRERVGGLGAFFSRSGVQDNVPLQMGNYQAPEGVAKHCCPELLDYNNPFKFPRSAGDIQLPQLLI